MTELSASEAAVVARFDAAADADESAVERVARAIMDADYMQATGGLMEWSELDRNEQDHFRSLARAAIDAMRPAPDAPQPDEDCATSVHLSDGSPPIRCVLRRGHGGGHIYDAGVFA